MLWSGSCTGCRAPAHSVPWRRGPMQESASVPHCASSLRLQGPGLGRDSGHSLPPPFGAWCDFYQVDLGYDQTSALEDFSPQPSWRVQGLGRRLFGPFANLRRRSSVILRIRGDGEQWSLSGCRKPWAVTVDLPHLCIAKRASWESFFPYSAENIGPR